MMSMISFDFIFFLVITIVAFFLCPPKYRWFALLLSSLYFYYSTAGTGALVTMLAVSLFVFGAGLAIEKSPVETKKRKFCLSIAVVLIVGWLAIVKLSTIVNWRFSWLPIPLGISYVSFSFISYLVDIYRGNDTADRNFLKFLTYVLFFPKISQGPISRHADLAPTIYGGGCIRYENICFGMQRMIWGYFKKIVIADRAAMFTAPIFESVSSYSGSMLVVAVILAALQLYCDFSGYMDIVLGFTEILGFKMDENFHHPFFSKSAAEFWRRWHITLGAWFKDYVYTPIVMSHPVKSLGRFCRKKFGKRMGNSLMKIIALSAVWILTGAWHGTGINYIVWGVYWGAIIIFSMTFESEIKKVTTFLHINTDAFSWKVFQMLRTFVIFCVGILITSVPSLSEIKVVARQVIEDFQVWNLYDKTLYSVGLNKLNFDILIDSLLVVLAVSILQEKMNIRKRIAQLNGPVRWFIYAFSISVVLFLGIYGVGYSTAGFAYSNF